MTRGDLYLVKHPGPSDPKRQRVFVVVSRQSLIESSFSSVVCAPVSSNSLGLATQVPVGLDYGLKHDSAIYCDELVSIAKNRLTDYVGSLTPDKILELNLAISIALDLPDEAPLN